MSDSSAPGTAVDLEAIQAVKTGLSTNIPYGYSLLYSSRQDSSFEKAGLVANAYVNEATGQILIAFRGPLSIPDGLVSSNTLERAALKVDLRIAFDDASVTTEMDREAQRLFSVVRDAAQGRGLSFTNQNVFVTGNSEGGFLAELLAKDENLSGETFGAPGIPGQQVNPAPNGNLINYLNKGDPVANLGSDALLAPFIAPAGTQYHYGKIQYIGSDTAGADLVKAAQVLFAPQDQFDIEAGLPAAIQLLGYAALNHAYATYASLLGFGTNAQMPTPYSADFIVNAGILAANYKLLEGRIGGLGGDGGATFQGTTSSQFSKSWALITSAQGSNGDFNNVLFQSPTAFKGAGAGTLDIVQTALKEQVVFKTGAWKSVQFTNGRFDVALKAASQAQGASTLSFDPRTGSVNIDNSTVTISNFTSLQVKTGEDATDFNVLDPTSNKIKAQLIVGGNSAAGNETLDSSLANLTLSLASGTDTLFHLGPNSTINAGGSTGAQAPQYELSVTGGSLRLSATDSISLNGTGFIQNSGTLTGSAGSTSLIIAAGAGQKVAGGSGNNIVVAAGANDTLSASQSGQKLIALGQANDVLNGQTKDASGLDKLIAVAGTVVGGNVSKAGNDTLNAGVGNNILIGDGVNTTFNIDPTKNPNAVDVVWGVGGTDAIDITGVAQVMVVNAPSATLASVKNLDVQKLFQEVKGFTANHLALANNVPPFAGQTTVIVINPTPTEQLTIDGIKVTGDVANYTAGNFAGTFDNSFGQGSVNQNFVALPDGTLGHQSWIVGLASGDFGITESNTDAGGFVANGTPTVNLLQDQVQASTNASGGSGGGSDPSVVDQSSVNLSNVSDTLVSITAASAFGSVDTLIAANGADTLTASGYQDTLIGNTAGSTLVNSGGYGTVAGYAINNVTVDLNANTARVNGSELSDTLIGIKSVAALGTGETLIGSSGVSTLTALAAGNTLIGGTGTTTLLGNANGSTLVAGSGSALAAYSASNVAVNLATGRATVAGSGVSDTLVGIHNVTINGMHSTLTGGTGGDTLTAGGLYELLLAGSGFESLATYGSSNTLIGGSSNDILTSNGYQNTLMAGTGANVLQSTGYGDTLIGNGLGSSLLGRVGNGAIAAYTIDNVLVDLGSNRATVSGSGVSDILENIIVAEALGHHDTLLGNSGDTTLIAAGSADTLLGGSGTTTLQSNAAGNMLTVGNGQAIATYAIDNVIVDLAAGSASVSGSSVHDTLVGITKATVSGQHDTILGGAIADVLGTTGSNNTLIGGTGAETLSARGTGNKLVAGSGTDTLSALGSNNTLIGGSGNDTLSSSGFFGTTTNTLIAGSGTNTLSSSGSGDTLLGGSGSDFLKSSGKGNSLVAGSGVDTLSTTGSNDTLFGNGGGSTLNGAGGSGALAAYTARSVTVNLATGTASVNGTSTSDTLIGFTAAAALGSNDTLIDGNAGSTLLSNAGGNTLVGGSGQTVAAYAINNVTVNLSASAAAVNGSSISDTLVGVHAAMVSGSNDTVLGSGAGDMLSSSGSGNTLISGAGAETLSSSGTNDVLLAGSGADFVSSSGTNNSLVAGTGVDTIVSSGFNDTVFGNGGGSTLDGSAGVGALAAYTASGVTVNLATGTASVHGTSTSDTLIGFTSAAALGSNDTLIDGDGGSTLFSNAAGNTLIGGAGQTVASYTADHLTINLALGTAGVNDSGISDALVGIEFAMVSGANDTLIGGSGADILSSSGVGNTLIAGSGIDTLSSTGAGDVLFGNLLGSTLQGSYSQNNQNAGAVAAYSANNVTIDLSAQTAQVHGSGVSDQLLSINTAAAFGSNDTLIGGSYGSSTLISSAGGNTLIAGTGATTALYQSNDVTINLVAGTAAVNGASSTDKLIGIMTAIVSGNDDTLVSGGVGNTLIALNTSASVSYAIDNLSIDLSMGTAGVNGSNAEDTLIGLNKVTVSGSHDSVVGGQSAGSFEAIGSHDTLIAGVGGDTLVAKGVNDTLVGNVAGSTLEAALTATATVALYTYDDVTIDLGAGNAASPGSSLVDTLIGITAATVTGAYDTLIAGGGRDTLSSSGFFNSLVGGSGADTLSSSGQQDTLIAGSGSQALISSGVGNTLIAGTAADLLTTSGVGDSLAGNALGSTLNGAGGSGAIAVYTMDNVTVDLAAGTGRVNGAAVADIITRIANATVSGVGDTAIAGTGASILSSDGSHNSLVGGSGADTLSSSGSNDTLIGGNGTDLITSSGSQNTLIAGSGTDILRSNGTGDVLLGGVGVDTISSSGTGNTLVAGGGIDTLSSTGVNDTLFGNGAGSTLNGTNGTGTVAAYALDHVTVDLAIGTATVNGSGVSDTLVRITSVLLAGHNDTLMGGTGATTVYSDGAGNTLIAGTGQTTIAYALDNVTVDLATSSAKVNGSSVSDTLVGITNAVVSGSGDTLIGGSGADSLASNGVFNTLIAGNGAETLSTSGLGDTLLAGAGADVLSSSGQNNVLIAGSAIDSLTSTGFGDTLVGNAAGSTLNGTNGAGTVVAYTTNNVTVDLATGTATVNGSSVSDTLLGITAAQVSGINDTLIGGSGATTLLSNAAGNTLEAGTGQTTVVYNQDNVTLNLATSSAKINGSSASDSLIGITRAAVVGFNDTLIGGSGSDVLSSIGENNTLIAGAGANTLTSSGFADTLIGNAAGSTLDGTNGAGIIADYSLSNVTVNLATGTATVNASGVSDTLLGITTALASGSNDTLIGGNGKTTLMSNAGGNTLVAGTGQTVAAYSLDRAVVNLATGSATVSGSSTSDTLIGVTAAAVSGANDTLIGNSSGDILTVGGTNDVVLAGTGVQTLISSGSSNTLTAGSGANTLSSSGSGDTLIGGAGADVLSSSGFDNQLIAGNGADSLVSTGIDDTFIGNGAGSVLDASQGTGATAVYSANGATISLATGTASLSGSSVRDTLIGISTIVGLGSQDTLVGMGGDTLLSTGSGETLVAGASGDTLVGGDGVNTVSFGSAASSSAVFGFSNGNWTVTVGGKTDTLKGVSKVQFADKTFELVDQFGSGIGGFQTVQSAIDAAVGGETILIAPGTYFETKIPAPYSSTHGGLYIDKPGLTLQGLAANGAFIVSAAQAQSGGPTIVSGAETDFGSNLFVGPDATGATIEGLHLAAGAQTSNKLVEFWADNVTIKNNFIDTFYDGVDTGAAGIYLDAPQTPIGRYLIDGNILNEGIYVANNVGVAADGISADQVISNNVFGGTYDTSSGNGRYDMVAVQGQIPGVGWQPDPAEVPTMTGNSRSDNSSPFVFRMTEQNPALFPSAAELSTILANNTSIGTSYAYVLNPDGTLHLVDRNNGADDFKTLYVANSLETLDLGLIAPNAIYGSYRNTIEADDTVIVQSVGATAQDVQVDNLNIRASASSSALTLALASGVRALTLGDYAAGQGAAVTVVGNNGGDAIAANSGNDVLNGGSGSDTLIAGTGNDILTGGGGYDVYKIRAAFGQTQINNGASDGATTAQGEIDFASGVTDERLWFVENGNDLRVDLLGTSDQLMIKDWFAGNDRAQVQLFITTGDGLRLDSQVSQLVQAIATYSANNPGFDPAASGVTALPNDPNLQIAVAAAWHA